VFSFGPGYLEADWNGSDFWNWNWNFFFEDPELDFKFHGNNSQNWTYLVEELDQGSRFQVFWEPELEPL
jgi:hypothetical protein